jgi:hypothetical protein
MDVPAALTAPNPAPIPGTPVPAPAPVPAAQAPAPSVAPAASGGGTGASASGTTAAIRPITGSAPPASSSQSEDNTITPVVAKLFNAAASNVSVSFQVTTDPDEVVTVFTDKRTGKEIVQFPSEAVIALAEMYDKDSGKVLDKSV